MFGFGDKNLVGIDIGTASIKLVELSRKSAHYKLETYGIVQMNYNADMEPNDGQALLNTTIQTLKELMHKSGVKTKRAVASLPTSTVFISVMDIPRLDSHQQIEAVERGARRIIPLPLEDVTVSWTAIPDDKNSKRENQSILLTAVPNHVIANYIKVFQELDLDPQAIEVEATALVRSLVGQDTSTVLIVDMGGKSSTINLIDNGFIYFSKNMNLGGEAITESIAKSLNVNLDRAEQFKKSLAAADLEGKNAPKSIQPIIDIIKNEIEQLVHLAQGKGRGVQKIILTGGGSNMSGLAKYISTFNIPVVIGNPWARVLVPEQLKPLVNDLGPTLAVSVGLAMRHED
jgi:type IV pilus assembly protein PilM